MARKNAPYTPEFRRQMIELVRSGRSPESLAKEFEPTAQAIRNWVAQAERDAGRRDDGVTTAERDEISRLRREVKQLKLERDILSKAAAWFARESESIPRRGLVRMRRQVTLVYRICRNRCVHLGKRQRLLPL